MSNIIKDGYLPFKNFKTYYRIVNPQFTNTPLLLIHGGPGSTHNYFEVLDNISNLSQCPVISYDQLGCGLSSIPDDTPELYNAHTWIEELQNLRNQLQLSDVHLLGQSWGGMMAIIYLCDYQPTGISSLILSSTLSSASLWASELHRMIKYLPNHMQDAIYQAEKTGNFDNEEYLQANNLFMKQHSYEITYKSPAPLLRNKVVGTTSYLTAWGPNEYNPMGNLKNYEYTNKLSLIKVPTLITSGTDDLCTPLIAKTMFDAIPYAEWELFENCRHMPFVDNNEKYLSILSHWLNHIK